MKTRATKAADQTLSQITYATDSTCLISDTAGSQTFY